MKRPVYTGLHYLMMPLVVGRLKWLARKNPGYGKNLKQRFGYTPVRAEGQPPLWIHAVSVGETIAAEPLVRRIQAVYPDLPLVITSTTPTGAEQVKRQFGETVAHQFAPYDLPAIIRRFADQVRPSALVVMETELWPNWIEVLSEKDIPVLVANARMSEKSAAGYARLGSMSENMMGALSLVAAQYEADARRFVELGASPDLVKVMGNLKADIQIGPADREIAEAAKAKVLSAREPVIIAASTHPGEDEIVLDAFQGMKATYPSALLYLVPRHPERADDIEKLMHDRALAFVRRSQAGYLVDQAQSVVLCDQLGELRGLFGAADMVLMGGTLVDHGGHNPLEPAAWGLPVLAGPSQRNFDSLFNEMESKSAMARVEASAPSMAKQLIELWQDQEKRVALGKAARDYLEAQGGAVDRLVDALSSFID